MGRNHLLLTGFSLMLALAVLLSACNMPGKRTPTPSGFQMINTAAAMTVAAQLTEISKPPVATIQPQGQFSSTSTPEPLGTQPASASPAPSQQPVFTIVPQTTQASQAGACDRAKFVKDVTVPDNTIMQPGESFKKTWRLQNVGKCTWDENYALVFVGGDPLGAPSQVALPGRVSQNQTVDISVNMVAPTSGGTYRSEWKLSNADQEIFGGGTKGNQPVWAQIVVAGTGGNAQTGSGALQFDFVGSASSASWYSAAGDSAGLPLAFGGPLDNPDGAALIVDQIRLETGQTSGKILLTIPMDQQDGYVYGIFPVYQVQAGDRFKARVGFADNPNGQCGAGRVIFQIAVRVGDAITTLQEIPAACDGSLTQVDLGLSNLRGQSVEFILTVRADGSPQDDWAVWNSPRITTQ